MGPEIIGSLEPKIPAKKHNIIAPQIPALAPIPVATPKARACGKATIAETTPPWTSPFSIFKYFFISSIVYKKYINIK